MNKIRIGQTVLALLFFTVGSVSSANAGAPPPSARPLADTYAKANSVILVQVQEYRPNPAAQARFERSLQKLETVDSKGHKSTILFATGSFNFPISVEADCRFNKVTLLKGKRPKQLPRQIPALFWSTYGAAPTRGDWVILFLGGPNNSYIVDRYLPFFKVDRQFAEYAVKTGKADFWTLVGDALKRPLLSDATLQVLQGSISPQVTAMVKPLVIKPTASKSNRNLYDPQLRKYDQGLALMMLNGQSQYIPQVVQLAEERALVHDGTRSLGALGDLKSEAAVPQLQPLLFHTNPYVRANAMNVLFSLAEADSLPYLLIAMVDPDSQTGAGIQAYTTAARLLGYEVPETDYESYSKKQGHLAYKLTKLWASRVKTRSRNADINSASLTARETKPLGPQLLSASGELKPILIEAIANNRESSAVPYLILTLFDSNPSVAFQASQALAKLTSYPLAGNEQDFIARRQKFVFAAYRSWRLKLVAENQKNAR